ncbi:hypothetical protein SLEP1_g12434 [Rubroshorea leprosula]|uniref:Uncharacterized protein n=1 Tax=Rubroshorea leprosula TaxID=152421 RepID=A0AAV5IMB2_9ROSI|nr:hypothetical protein SLEP1_g12434 [Rubroshorea leprosula]
MPGASCWPTASPRHLGGGIIGISVAFKVVNHNSHLIANPNDIVKSY